uniref:Crossover junction endonuclease EME2 n=1 Tax=Otus sunia TaxID=257818 RepID=A0A8C8A7D8_9STRI
CSHIPRPELWETSVGVPGTFTCGCQPVLDAISVRAQTRRQLQSQELTFCTAGAWASGVRVERDGTGLRQVWKRQIQEFNRVSPATAAAIAEAYPSPSLLLQAYKECSTEDEKRLLLRDIPVKSDVSGKDHRVGPDLSRHIYLFMVSTDPDLVLDLSRVGQPPCFIRHGSAVAELLLGSWPGEAADSVSVQTCASINVLLRMLSSASGLSFPLLAAPAF